MKTEFENKLKELGYSYQCNTDGIYIIYMNIDTDTNIRVQLICSEPVDNVLFGSRNNNEIKGIGVFRIRLPMELKGQDYLILAFWGTTNLSVEYIIVPPEELITRLVDCCRVSNENDVVEIVFWLMPDDHLFETTVIGAEAEWYYLSKGLNGRMADGSTWDYTRHLNDWSRLREA